MIVDDSEGDQVLTKIMIEDYNSEIEILQAYDGREALDILSNLSSPPTVIFLDINMPGIDGYGFLEDYNTWQIRSPVVMITSSDQPKDKEKSLSYECVKKYCIKPVELEEFIEMIESCTN